MRFIRILFRKSRQIVRQWVAWYYNTFHSTPKAYRVSFNNLTGPYTLVMRLSDGPGMRKLRRGGLEMDVRSVFLPLIRPGWVCCDVGAQAGDYMVEMALLAGPQGRVFAYEPIPHYAELIEATLQHNHLANVTFKAAAVGAQSGTISVPYAMLTGSLLKPGRTAKIRIGSVSGAQIAQVPIVRLDDELEQLDAIKMDVEGYEVHTLNGMKTLIVNNPAMILLLEVHNRQLPAAGCSLEELATLLLGTYKFVVYQISAKHCLCCQQPLPISGFPQIGSVEHFTVIFQQT